MSLRKIGLFLALGLIVMYFCILFIPVSNGIFKPESTQEILGQNFEVDIPSEKTEASFCFRLDEPQSVMILGTDYFEITQDNLIGHAIMDENGNSHFGLSDATGCWEIKRNSPMKMRFINDYSDIQFINHNTKVEGRLLAWRIDFVIFCLWIVSRIVLEYLSDSARDKSTTSETEDSEDDSEFEDCIEEGCCTHCGSELPEDSENCPHCGAPQNKPKEE